MDRLTGKVALVTGGASGMGAAHARGIVAEGGQVLIGDVNDLLGEQVAAELGASAAYAHLDVTSAADWDAAVRTAEERFGKLNVLVNNAGILNGGAIGDYTLKDWELVMAINATGPFLGITAAVDALRRGQPASIINVSSAAGLHGISGMHGYTASKYALRGLTKSVALELTNQGVRVNSIHPGNVATPMTAAMIVNTPESDNTDLLTRAAQAEEITALVVYLASDESSFSTGSEFVVDGGITAGARY